MPVLAFIIMRARVVSCGLLHGWAFRYIPVVVLK